MLFISSLSADIHCVCCCRRFCSHFTNYGKQKVCLLLTNQLFLGAMLVKTSGAILFSSWAHPTSPSKGSSQCKILLISCDVAVVKHFLLNIFFQCICGFFPKNKCFRILVDWALPDTPGKTDKHIHLGAGQPMRPHSLGASKRVF